MYYKWDFDGDGQLETKIWIPERKPGNYSIQVIPELYANASDTFTLTVSPMEQKWGYTPIDIAQNITISNIPEEPYTFEFKQRTDTNISYTGDVSGYMLDTINLTAALSTENGSLLSGKTINFVIGNQSTSAVTDSNGIATAFLTLNQTPSEFYYVEYGFDGDTDYLPYYDSQPFEIINKPPVAVIGGPYTGNEGSAIIFNGSGSYDPDGTIVSYEWDLNGDGNFSDAQDAVAQNTWADDYSGNVSLKVTDDCGAVSRATTTVTINNVPPIVETGPDIVSVLIGSTVNFNGSFTDPGTLDTHTIVWNFGDGTPTVSGTLTPTHTYASGGNYTVTLTVTDDDGGVGTDTLTVHVNYPPVANPGGPYTGNEGSSITFNASSSYDPDGTIVSYEWDLNNDGNFSDAQGAVVQHTWLDDYSGNVSLRVKDDCSAVSIATTTINVSNVAPTVNAGPDIGNIVVGSTVNFNGSFTDPGTLDTHSIVWNFGDGTPIVAGTLTLAHTYNSSGNYTVTLTVTDDDGGAGSDTTAVTVWSNIFQDPAKGTELRINTGSRTFQFLAPGYDSGIKKANMMIVTYSLLTKSQHIFIAHCDNNLFLSADAYGGQSDYCLASLWNKKTWRTYWLYDKWGLE
jgi:PKD repeat protein